MSNWRHSNRLTTVHNGDTRLGIHANAIHSHGHMRFALIFRGPFFTIATIMRKCIIFHAQRGRPNRPNDIDKNPITMKGYKYTSHRRWAINRDAAVPSHHVWAFACVCFANVSRQIGRCSPRNNLPACNGWQLNTHTQKRWKRFCGRVFFADFFRQYFHEAIIFAWDSHIDFHKWKSPASLSLPVDSVSLTRVFCCAAGIYEVWHVPSIRSRSLHLHWMVNVAASCRQVAQAITMILASRRG